MDRTALLNLIADQARQGEINFPTGLDVSMNILKQLDDPDCHIELAAQLMRGEPLMAARVVAVANSAAYNRRAGQEVTDLRNAISRIGLRTVRTLATAIATRQMAGAPSDPALRKISSQLWEHTAHVASLAHVIARKITHQDPETAFFAGIVHEIGGFYLISRAPDFPGLLDGEPADWVETAEPVIGRAILARLGVPDAVMQAVEALWEGLLALPAVSLGDTLLLANELAPVASPLYEAGNLRRDPNNAHIIDAINEDGVMSDILKEAADEVSSLTAALRF